MKELAEIRFYSTGWVFRIGPFCLRWNHQENYSALSIERLAKDTHNIGGMTLYEWLTARRQSKESHKKNNRLTNT